MQTTYLQTLIAHNATAITLKEATIATLKTEGIDFKKAGEKAFSVESYRAADRQRPKLAKLVQLQRALKAELKMAQSIARCNRMMQRLIGAGIKFDQPHLLTSQELEQALVKKVAEIA